MRIQRTSFIPLILLTIFLCIGVRDVHAEIIIRAPNNLGLVGYWSFDEGTGTQASDLSGNGNDGDFINNPTWVSGRVGNALQFGGNSYVHLGNPQDDSLDFGTGDFTLSAWVYQDSLPGTWKSIINKGASGTNGYGIEISNSNTYTCSIDAGTNQHEMGPTPTLGEWQHIVCVFDRDQGIYQYVDGSNVFVESYHSGNTGSITSPHDFAIGEREGTGWVYNGKIDEVRLYNRALSETEVQSLYNVSKGTLVGEFPAGHHTEGLVAHYTFDGSTISGSTLSDAAGDNDGTISSGPSPRIGRVGQAMEFNSSGDNVNLGNPSDLQMSGDQTIAMWLYPYNFSARRNPYEKAYGGEGTITQETNGHLNYYYGTSGTNTTPYQGFSSNSALILNTWNHIAIVRDLSANPRRLYWYINGVQTSSASASYAAATSGTRSAQIGRGYAGQYNGLIDDLRIYNRALSAEEVRGLAGGGTGVLEVTDLNERGSILMERWTGIGGTSLSGFPPASAPNHTEERTSFEIPTGWGDNYGVRMRGYLYPETSGNYTFWLASDDNGELWLSTNSNPANKVRIARVTSYTSSRQWNKEVNQKSVEIPLVAGQRYYIEALQKEGGGGDNLAVSWKLNDTSNPANGNGDYIIPGSVLSPWYE